MSLTIVAKKRVAGKADLTRAEGLLPAVVYGQGSEAISVSFPYSMFEKLYREAGESSLIDFTIEGEKSEPVKVLVQEVQHNPVSQRISHVDLRQINMNKEMEAEVELNFVGESLAVKGLGGTLVKVQHHLAIKCLPKFLVHSINVDLSSLKTFTDVIRIKDLQMPEGLVALEKPEEAVAKVSAPLTEDELKAMDTAPAKKLEEIEVEKKGKKEEEGAAGATPAAGDKAAPAKK